MKVRLFSILLLVSLMIISGAGSVLASDTTGTIDTGVDTGLGGVVKDAPTATPPPGTYTSSRSVTLTADGSNRITYSLDDWANTIEYTSPISITSSKTFKARAYFPDGTSYEDTYTYTIRSSSGGGGGGGDTTPTIGINVNGTVNTIAVSSSGATGQLISLTSPDGKIVLTIPVGTIISVLGGGIPANISILPDANPPAPPEGQNMIGFAYQCTPSGITFSPAITLTWQIGSLPEGINASGLIVAFYDTTAKTWITVPAVYNAGSIAATISHFTDYAVLTSVPASPTPSLKPIPSTSVTPTPVAPTSTTSVTTTPTATETTTPVPQSSPTFLAWWMIGVIGVIVCLIVIILVLRRRI
jgi:hypothetical protein